MEAETLYSLEVVVDKIYIPHTTCRFPAVAFRLLDLPTILIEHVEEDLAEKIKYKVSRDPYYDVPQQFPDLKDKNGNFLVKKGKSCLFRISSKSLKNHLTNTPMYVMVLDHFEKVPKLLGNSTVPLDEVMEEIVQDIKTMGITVPSVHGDKGLFKIFSLMGKEIGYVVMGYRLLSLGPGLIQHIPESAIAKRASESKVISVKPTEEHVFAERAPVAEHVEEKNLISTHEMGSMTEPEMKEMLVQTVDMCDKQVHVAISALSDESQKAKEQKKSSYTTSTQTDKRKKMRNAGCQNILNMEIDIEDDSFFISNTAQPPPLFYNSENEPKVKIEHAFNYDDDQSSIYSDDLQLEDLAEENEKIKQKPVKVEQRPKPIMRPEPTILQQNVQNIPQSQNIMMDRNNAYGPLFPILTALLNELSSLQNPALIQKTMQQVQQISATQAQIQKKQTVPAKVERSSRPPELQPVRTFVQQNVQKTPVKDRKAGATKKMEKEVENVESRGKPPKSHPQDGKSADNVPSTKGRGWIRKAPELGVKKSKLSYGLTNTQRLRLAKQNPEWLKTMEKEEMEAKAAKQKVPTKPKTEEEFPTGEVSDTLTEVRRLALKNLNATDEDTLKDLDLSMQRSKRASSAKQAKGRKHSSLRKRSKSPKHKMTGESKLNRSTSDEANKDQYSPQADDEESEDEIPSVPSQRSIEVRIPSAQMYHDDSEATLNESESDSRKRMASRFPGFADHDTSLPETIDGDLNKSLNDRFDDDSPMESTRNEKSRPEKMTRSTLDYDSGTHQFQSTEEPELQKLMSSGERSEISDVMSSGRLDRTPSPVPISNSQLTSARFPVLNPKASIQSPIPAIRRSQLKLDIGQASGAASPSVTPRLSRTPSPSSKLPTPRLRKTAKEKRFDFRQESLHTESVSSYMPSPSDEDDYSDDFQEEISPLSTPDRKRRMIPSTKLGYTIH